MSSDDKPVYTVIMYDRIDRDGNLPCLIKTLDDRYCWYNTEDQEWTPWYNLVGAGWDREEMYAGASMQEAVEYIINEAIKSGDTDIATEWASVI